MAKRIETSIAIDASADRVWRVLVDFPSYPQWNPFIKSIDGEAAAGNQLTVRLQAPGGMAMTFRPRVLAASPGRELRWVGRLLVPGLFDGEHRFVIERTGADSCRLTQGETFTGILVGLFGRNLRATADGFDQMNQALKVRVEKAKHAAA
jgi:hypothetical protein